MSNGAHTNYKTYKKREHTLKILWRPLLAGLQNRFTTPVVYLSLSRLSCLFVYARACVDIGSVCNLCALQTDTVRRNETAHSPAHRARNPKSPHRISHTAPGALSRNMLLQLLLLLWLQLQLHMVSSISQIFV